MTRQYTPWSMSDIKYLKANAGTISGKEIASHLGRHVTHIYTRARLLGLSLCLKGERSHLAKHSHHDIELVRQLHDAGMPARLIAEKMEMSVSHVYRVTAHERRPYE